MEQEIEFTGGLMDVKSEGAECSLHDNFHFYFLITHRSLILETCLKIWKFSLQRDNDFEVLWRFPQSLDTMGANRRSTLPLIEQIA